MRPSCSQTQMSSRGQTQLVMTSAPSLPPPSDDTTGNHGNDAASAPMATSPYRWWKGGYWDRFRERQWCNNIFTCSTPNMGQWSPRKNLKAVSLEILMVFLAFFYPTSTPIFFGDPKSLDPWRMVCLGFSVLGQIMGTYRVYVSILYRTQANMTEIF